MRDSFSAATIESKGMWQNTTQHTVCSPRLGESTHLTPPPRPTPRNISSHFRLSARIRIAEANQIWCVRMAPVGQAPMRAFVVRPSLLCYVISNNITLWQHVGWLYADLAAPSVMLAAM